MLTLELNSGSPHLAERRRAEPVLLVAAPFSALALFSLLTPGPLTALRVLTALVLAGAALLCFALGRPRTWTRPLPSAPAKALELASADALDSYRVLLVGHDGARELVLSRSEPAGVLRDALSLSEHLGVPLVPGWGLDEEALSLLREPNGGGGAPKVRISQIHGPVPDQRIGAMTALWAAIFIPGATVVLASSPYRPVEPPSALALILPALTSLIALVIGLFLLGLRQHLVIRDGRLEAHRSWFGVKMRSKGQSVEQVLGVFGVAPHGRASEHLVVATADGPVAIPTDRLAGRPFQGRPGVGDQSAGRAAE